MQHLNSCLRGAILAAAVMWAADVCAQRVQFPSPVTSPPVTGGAVPPATSPPPIGTTYSAPGATLNQGIQPFDPYSSVAQPPPIGPPGTQPPVWTPPPNGVPPAAPPAYYPQGAPPYYSPGVPPPPGSAAYPPQQPSSLYPQGFSNPLTTGGPPYDRFFQDTGFTYTFLAGSEGSQMQINEVDISTSMVFEYFAHSGQGLRVTPGITLDFLDGPQPPAPPQTGMPSQLYGAYIDTQWDPRFTPQFGAELNFRVGVYSDYGTLTDDSIRYTGTGVGVLQVTPTMAVKLGATYLDRLQIKILPAIGLLWTPTPQKRADIYFPAPKLAHYWKTVGNTDIWWYLGGEYGGGDWTMQRLVVDGGMSHLIVTRVDYNDIRVFGGLEWFGLNNRHGLFEIGYVFNRELVWELGDPPGLDLEETLMLRAGFRF